MNWKKFLVIGLAVSAFAVAAAPRAEARISVGIDFGFPVGFGYYRCGPAYYPYGYNYYYGPRRVYYAPRYYRHHYRHHYRNHNRRVHYRNRHWR